MLDDKEMVTYAIAEVVLLVSMFFLHHHNMFDCKLEKKEENWMIKILVQLKLKAFNARSFLIFKIWLILIYTLWNGSQKEKEKDVEESALKN